MSSGRRTGGQLIVDGLLAQGVEMVYAVAGESYLEVLDALVDAPQIRVITCRQEGGAAFMAEAYGKLTGRPAVLMVTRGPGASNAAIGIHTAYQDSTPLIVLVGQVSRLQLEREAFQEVDYRRFFSEMSKWAAQIDVAARIPEYLSHAFHVATSGRPGPVVLALPEDMLREVVAAPAVAGRHRPTVASPAPDDVDALRDLLARAERPMVLVGGAGWSDGAAADIAAFAGQNDLPVCCSFRRQDIVDNRLPVFVGDLGTGASPALVKKVQEADLLLVVNARVGEITSQSYAVMSIPEPGCTLVHIHASAEEIGRVYRPTLGIQSGPAAAAAALRQMEPISNPRWAGWRAECRAAYEANLVPPVSSAPFDPGAAMVWLRDVLPDDAVLTTDAGNFSGWPQRFLQYRRPGRQLGPTNGAMGYSVPAAISAKLACPDRVVVSFVGDGGFLMTGQELATALQNGVGPIICLFNNNMYGTIRMHQERRFPGRVSATDLHNPDFVALARAYGADAERITTTEEFRTAFTAAMTRRTPTVLELRIDPQQITTRATIDDIRADALKRLSAGRQFEEAT
jgi:acetolactate synthase-1/2/3 large subunit